MTVLRSDPAKRGIKLSTYGQFQGLDTSRDQTVLETRRGLHTPTLNNAYVDWRGQIVLDPPMRRRLSSSPVRHIRFFAPDEFVYAALPDSGKIQLGSSRGHTLEDAFLSQSNISSVVYDRQVHLFSRAQPPIVYTGSIYRGLESTISRLGPAYSAVVGRRLILAGSPQFPTTIDISRVDTTRLFNDEASNDENVLRAGQIDVANLLGTSDQVTGISPFEQDRLVVFTNDRALIYVIDVNIDNWRIDDRANIMLGSISHNSIVRAGVDLLFCSRSGVHNIQRSPDNGILVYSRSLSDKIDSLYRSLVRTVSDPQDINAVFNPDDARYYIFFPSRSGLYSRWLSLSLNPEENEVRPAWSTGSIANAQCGDFLAGHFVFGCSDGPYDVLTFDSEEGDRFPADITTPWLWHQDVSAQKRSHSLTIQATGRGTIEVEVVTDTSNAVVWSKRIEIEGEDDGVFDDVPLFQEYQTPMELRYRGLRLHFKLIGTGAVRLTGFAIAYQED